jgi:mannose-6-phosphate isomerase-like protein (cupin superfamily)
MKNVLRNKGAFIFPALALLIVSASPIIMDDKEPANRGTPPMVVPQFLEEAKKNNNWKTAFATAMDGQIVFMNISPLTNPKNEIGEEVHSFDQVIIIVEGTGQAVLSGTAMGVNVGDMIFIPQGTSHNVMNLNKDKPLKIISFYSENDIPKGAVYKSKADELSE